MLPEVCDHLLNACRNRLSVGWKGTPHRVPPAVEGLELGSRHRIDTPAGSGRGSR